MNFVDEPPILNMGNRMPDKCFSGRGLQILAVALLTLTPITSRSQSDAQIVEKLGIPIEQVQQLHSLRGMSNQILDQMPAALLPRVIRRLSQPDLPEARIAFRALQERSGKGGPPANARINALQQLKALRLKTLSIAPKAAGLPAGKSIQPFALVPQTAGLNPNHSGWTYLGPGNIGGRTRSIVFDPTNGDRIWVASVGGGIWRTEDGGNTFNPVDDLMANLAVSCMAIDPTNPKILYAGTGEGFYNVDAIRGAGIFRTVDGNNWKQIPSTNSRDFEVVNRLAVSPNGKIVLAATLTGMFRSNDIAKKVWSKRFAGEISDVKFHPTDSSKAVASGLHNGTAYYSFDGGATWKPASVAGAWTGRVEITYARKNPSIVYASVNVNSGEIWRSTDGGKTYSKQGGKTADGKPANYLGNQGWYDNIIWAGDPTNENLVVVGGVDLWRSTDAGNTLVDISTWWSDKSSHADHHTIAAHPKFNGTTNRVALFGNDGGLYKTNDLYTVGNDAMPPRDNGWIKLDNAYGVTQFYAGAGNPATGIIIGGAQDNGTVRFSASTGPNKWTSMFGGDGGWSAADLTDANYFYGEYIYLNIHRSTNAGLSAEYISGLFWDEKQNPKRWACKPVPYQIPDACAQRALFIAPFVLDPNNPNRILAGGMSLWRTDDAKTAASTSTGPKWASIKNPSGSLISAIVVASGNPNIVWVGHEQGELYRSVTATDVNPAWSRLDGSAVPLPARYVTSITLDAKDTNVVYITYGGFEKSNIWKTTNSGMSWTSIGGALPTAPVRTVAVHPKDSRRLYIGTEVGVFASEDGGSTWSPTNEGPTNASVDHLFWMGETLVAATHGRGMFSINLGNAVP